MFVLLIVGWVVYVFIDVVCELVLCCVICIVKIYVNEVFEFSVCSSVEEVIGVLFGLVWV